MSTVLIEEAENTTKLLENYNRDKIYSNRLVQSYFKYMDEKLGVAKTKEILEKEGIDRLAVSDLSDFHTAATTFQLTEVAMEATGENDLPYLLGRQLPATLGTLEFIVAGITSPGILMKTFGTIESKLARKTINTVANIGPNRYRAEISFKDGYKEKAYICRNRIGSYEAISTVFGLPYAKVEHPKCAHKGDANCIYEVEFPNYQFIIFKRIAIALSFVALGFTMSAIIKSGGWPVFAALGTVVSALLCGFIYKGKLADRNLEWSNNSLEGLNQQYHKLEAGNAKISFLQELTFELSRINKPDLICNHVADFLISKFPYGSSQLWLISDDGKYLECRSAIGYPEHIKVFISNTRFKIGENWNNPYGLLVQTLEQRKTLILNDIPEAIKNLSSRTQEFMTTLNLSSMIITPLIHEDRAIGIIAAENHDGSKVVNADRLLFQSIANIVSNSLVKADLFASMERKIEERTQQLEVTSNKLLAAQEMAIQSEKLSALGQMAAGVAHEINNPLNFLVNILPDLRKDIDALEAIRTVALEYIPDAATKAKLASIAEAADLETHLEEKDFVFSRIDKALKKSTHIANSLKVFSRTSTKEAIAFEPLSGMVEDMISLIPQNNRGDTEIVLDIDPKLQWKVNRNEVEQAFLVLIKNAIEAMKLKGCLEIKAHRVGQNILIDFKDNGPGISEEIQKKVFEPFFTTKPPGQGTGLGLTIASEIVRKYGARLSLRSEVGKGSTFTITIDANATQG